MTVAIPNDLEAALRRRAEQRQATMEEIVREALTFYITTPAETIDELIAWQEIRDEAIELVDKP